MQTIHKYPVSIEDRFHLQLPRDASFLTVQVQAGAPCMWWLVDTAQPTEAHHFAIAGTGQPFPDYAPDVATPVHLGTFQLPPFVWHLFEFMPWGRLDVPDQTR